MALFRSGSSVHVPFDRHPAHRTRHPQLLPTFCERKSTSFFAGINWLVNLYRCWPEGIACGPGGFSDEYELFRFPVGSHFDYGWLELSLDASPYGGAVELTPIAYAYETSGRPIPAGYTGIPEPPQLPLALSALAFGAIGLREWRNRRPQTT